MNLRPYQQECIDRIGQLQTGSYLIQMATGLGKTVTFSRIPRRGRMLILSHREELVRQPLKYFDCMTGVELAGERSSPMDEVVSASVQSLVRRLDRFAPEEFDVIVTDEAHHAAARTYRKIYGHFRPRLHLGFTATPNRGDRVRLDDIFQEIIFERDLKWGIQNGYLCDIRCLRVNIGYDVSKVASRMGDYAPGELERAVNVESHNDAVAQAYREYARGATLIFAASVNHAREIARRIPGAAAVTAESKERRELVERFARREIPVLVNCMIFTEGTDLPLVETVIIARPTQNDSLYAQMVGRGLRPAPGKDKLTLIDCVGVTGKARLCTAPSLLGVDLSRVPVRRREEIQGDLFDLPALAERACDVPENWIINAELVDLWAREQRYDTHGVNWFRLPDGALTLSLPGRRRLYIPPQDELGRVHLDGERAPMQRALDRAYLTLCGDFGDSRALWDRKAVEKWGGAPATDKQKSALGRHGIHMEGLTKAQASQILNRVMGNAEGARIGKAGGPADRIYPGHGVPRTQEPPTAAG